MVRTHYKISVPGSVMLLGEHAVLQGSKAVSCAINQRMTVELIPDEGKQICIMSDRLGNHHVDLSALKTVKPFEFVLAAIAHYQSELPSGFTLKITSDFSEKMGLGSSAAVTVGVVSVLQQWLMQSGDALTLFQICLNVIRSIQGFASGADIAASILGGGVVLQPKPLKLQSLTTPPSFQLIYCGYKTPTVDVVAHVQRLYQNRPEQLARLYQAIADCADTGIAAIEQQDWPALGKIFDLQQKLMVALGVSDVTIDKIIAELRRNPQLLGAKISGSGLGDCVVALTADSQFKINLPQEWQNTGIQIIPAKVALQGVIIE